MERERDRHHIEYLKDALRDAKLKIDALTSSKPDSSKKVSSTDTPPDLFAKKPFTPKRVSKKPPKRFVPRPKRKKQIPEF